MKSIINLIIFGLLIAGLIVISTCSPGDSNDNITGPANDDYIPPVTNNWRDQNDLDHTLLFNTDSANTNVPEGVFTGEESHLTNANLDNNPVSGSFKNSSIQFTIQRSLGNITYAGNFDTTGGDIKIRTASSPTDSLILGQ